MTNEAREERIHIKDRQIAIVEDMLAVVEHMRKHLQTMHPEETERCWQTLRALDAEYNNLNAHWDIVVFGEVA